ncbi:MAG: hypothetical protein MZV70_32940 [Desulfobacterales bacterium]|nr:hypothetical protein [Desulfobacterales bacterium]
MAGRELERPFFPDEPDVLKTGENQNLSQGHFGEKDLMGEIDVAAVQTGETGHLGDVDDQVPSGHEGLSYHRKKMDHIRFGDMLQDIVHGDGVVAASISA